MFGSVFYFSTIRKYVMLVGTLFDDIYIQRSGSDGEVVEMLKVPITYAPKDKMLARVLQDPGIDRPTAVSPLPMISFEMGQVKYAGDRKLRTTGRIAKRNPDNPGEQFYQYNPVPYDFSFRVYVYAKNAEDGVKIIEQILPYFTPDWTTSVKLLPEMDITMDIPVVLKDVKYEDTYDKSFQERRAIIWSLDLVLNGWLYGPIKKTGVIKFANVSFYAPSVPDGQLESAVGKTPLLEKLIVHPGLTIDGKPTSNAAQSIPWNEIEVTDDYGFITTVLNADEVS
jgi:hypothetical protein